MIDVGCGTGRWLLHFQQSGVAVFGIDLCDAMLFQSAACASLRGRLMLGDVERLPFCDNAADLILCSLALGYFPNLRKSFSELARICAYGGRVAISDLHPKALASGWTRSFKRQCAAYEIDHYVYQWKQINEAASEAGLRLTLQHAACFEDPERSLFEKCGKGYLFTAAAAVPALFAAVWERPC
jgi:ubiquinone/menaquinone biosynthesis C-methylase UbiE